MTKTSWVDWTVRLYAVSADPGGHQKNKAGSLVHENSPDGMRGIFVEPEVAIRAERHVLGVAHGSRRGEFADLAEGGNTPDEAIGQGTAPDEGVRGEPEVTV